MNAYDPAEPFEGTAYQDSGILENFTISNIAMMDVGGYPIYITTGKRNRGPDVTTVSWMRNILI